MVLAVNGNAFTVVYFYFWQQEARQFVNHGDSSEGFSALMPSLARLDMRLGKVAYLQTHHRTPPHLQHIDVFPSPTLPAGSTSLDDDKNRDFVRFSQTFRPLPV